MSRNTQPVEKHLCIVLQNSGPQIGHKVLKKEAGKPEGPGAFRLPIECKAPLMSASVGTTAMSRASAGDI